MTTYSRRQQGFTLIEAAVAIAVVAILSGIIVPLVVKNLQDSQIARAKNDIQVIAAGIASQIKDTGGRPRAAAGPGSSTGATDGSNWWSGTAAASAPTGVTGTANNSFTNLFTAPTATLTAAQGNTLFGTTVGAEFSYKGPYMAGDVTAKTDPWGSSYVILGYDAAGQTANSPIWVVCAGPDKAILDTNIAATSAAIPTTWTITAGSVSADDIVVRVN